MIGIDFISFLILLAIGAVVAAGLHYGLSYYVIPGHWSFLSKVVWGWLGAWLGSPVFGHWFPEVKYQEVYIIPAILGAAALLVIVIDWHQTSAQIGRGSKPSG